MLLGIAVCQVDAAQHATWQAGLGRILLYTRSTPTNLLLRTSCRVILQECYLMALAMFL